MGKKDDTSYGQHAMAVSRQVERSRGRKEGVGKRASQFEEGIIADSATLSGYKPQIREALHGTARHLEN